MHAADWQLLSSGPKASEGRSALVRHARPEDGRTSSLSPRRAPGPVGPAVPAFTPNSHLPDGKVDLLPARKFRTGFGKEGLLTGTSKSLPKLGWYDIDV